MTQEHYIAIAIGALCGVLVLWVLIRFLRRDVPAINYPIETNGEADLIPREIAVPSHEKLAEAAQALNGKTESFADVKDTF